MPRPKNPENYYWTKDMDDKIVHYNSLTDPYERDQYFNENVYQPLNKLAECITRRWRWDYVPYSYDDIQRDLLTILTTKLKGYDPSKGFPSYSYFSIVAKNYLISLNNKAYKEAQRTVPFYKDNSLDPDDHLEAEMEKAFEAKHPPPALFADTGFLEELRDYWHREQLQKPTLFLPEYNPVLEQFLEIIKNPNIYEVRDGGRKDFGKLIRQSKAVQEVDKRHPTKQKASKCMRIFKLIKKVNRLAYHHYLKRNTLDDFRTTSTIANKQTFNSMKLTNS